MTRHWTLTPGLILGLTVVLAHATFADETQEDPVLITGIAADDQHITLTLSESPSSPVGVAELRVYEDPDRPERVIWEGQPDDPRIRLDRFDDQRDLLFSRFLLVDPDTEEPLGSGRFVDNLDNLPAPDHELPWPEEIKGISNPEDLDDIVELGVRHVHINVSIAAAFHFVDGGDPYLWEMDGQEFRFNRNYIDSFDQRVRRMTEDGINVVAVILNYTPGGADNDHVLVHPQTSIDQSPHGLGAFNLTDEQGLEHYIALLDFLAHRYTQPDAPHGRIGAYVIGNEIDTHWVWHNMGEATPDRIVRQHADELRMAYYALRRQHRHAQVYTSLTHCWATPNLHQHLLSLPGKDLLDAINNLAREEGNFPWNLAHHPYPQDMFNPRFWHDELAMFGHDTPMVTMKNVEVLVDYLQQDHYLYNGQPRRLILSEQGFHAPEGENGEAVQAAAYAYAYHRLSRIPGIGAFILHRHVDHRLESGLRFGLWVADPNAAGSSVPLHRRRIWDVVQAAGTDQQDQTFAFALDHLPYNSWEEAAPRQGPFPEQAPEWQLEGDEESIVFSLLRNISEADVEHALTFRLWSRQGEMAIYHHPPFDASNPTRATFTLALPEAEALALRFGIAKDSPQGDGVVFSVFVNDEEVWSAEQTDASRSEHEVDLTAHAGQEIDLTLQVRSIETSAFDQALWLMPRIVETP